MERYVHYTDSSRFILPALDVLIIFGAFRVAEFIESRTWAFTAYAPFFFAIFALLWWIISRQYANIYRLDRLISYAEKLANLMRAFLLHAALIVGAAILLHVSWPPASYLVAVYGMAIAGVLLCRVLLAFFYRAYQRYFAQPHSRFVIVGSSESGQELYHFLTAHDLVGNQFKGFLADEPVPSAVRPLVRGSVASVKEYCKSTEVDEIYYALPLDRHELIEDLSTFAADNFLSFRIVPDYCGTVRKKDVGVMLYDHMPILTVRREPLGIWTNQMLKRMFDIVFSGLVILLLFPIILPLLALIIKLDSPGPVFFKQLRPGKRNQLFPCFKLRTMRTDHNQSELQATKADPRVTRIGYYLRKYNLDELPQFFNVFLGHMSVVGPRPNMISQLEEYSKRIRTYQMRHAVTPGITGYAQVNGWRGETRAPNSMEKRVEYDLKYLENWSFSLDLQIIGQTVRNMVRGEENAY
jgi:putative colanic acid biosynthesis UDP-glucose lipid carrier transferase